MEGAGPQMVAPLLGIVAAAAVTFYAVSFFALREKSFEDLDEFSEESEGSSRGEFRSVARWRQRRAQRKAAKEAKKRN